MMPLFLILFVAYLPFQISLSPVAGIDLASLRIVVILLVVLWFLDAVFRKSVYVPSSPIVLFLLLFMGASVLSLLAARQEEFALRKLFFLLNFAPLFFITADYVRRDKATAQKIVAVLCASGCGVAVLGLLQFLSQFAFGAEHIAAFWGNFVLPLTAGKTFGNVVLENPSWFVESNGAALFRALGFFPDPHNLGLFLGMVLPFALLKAVTTKNPKIRIRWGAAALVIFAVLLLTFSRGAYLGLLASLLFFAVFVWTRLSKTRQLALIACGVLVLILLLPWNAVGIRFFEAFDPAEGSSAGRLLIWQEGVVVASSSLLTGVGIGNYAYVIDPLAGYHSPISAHNAYLEIGIETGIFGLAAFILLVWWPVSEYVRMRMTRPPERPLGRAGLDGKQREYALSAAASFVFFGVHSLFETTLWNPVNFALLMLVLALAATPQFYRKQEANFGT